MIILVRCAIATSPLELAGPEPSAAIGNTQLTLGRAVPPLPYSSFSQSPREGKLRMNISMALTALQQHGVCRRGLEPWYLGDIPQRFSPQSSSLAQSERAVTTTVDTLLHCGGCRWPHVFSDQLHLSRPRSTVEKKQYWCLVVV